jgi:hypothetical protein
MGQSHFVLTQQSLQTNESTENLVAALKARVLFTVMREALKHEKLPVGQGWSDVVDNAKESTSQGARFRKFLSDYLAEANITGDRYVLLYDVGEDEIQSLARDMKGAIAHSPDFGAVYPLPIAKNQLASATDTPELCEVRALSNGDFSLVFCSARSYDDKLAIAAKDLPQQVLDHYAGIDKLVTYRKNFHQAYDVVTLRTNLRRIEICIDEPGKSKTSEIEVLPMKILSACALHVQHFKGMGAKPPENLFAAIAGMYYQGQEGKVIGLAFRTLTGSIKRERMTPGNDDLRDEKFHHAGMDAVGQKISPYELILEYDSYFPTKIATLKLSALIRELSSATPTLHGCYVSSTSFAAFEQALNRLVTYIYTDEQPAKQE